MRPLVVLSVAGILVLILVVLESWRQTRKFGRGSGRGASLLRAGMLEAQSLLEPDRKVEIFKVEEKRDFEAEIRRDEDPPVRRC